MLWNELVRFSNPLQQYKEVILCFASIVSASGKEYLQRCSVRQHQTGCRFCLEDAIIMLCAFLFCSVTCFDQEEINVGRIKWAM